jgi:hypothetical protein
MNLFDFKKPNFNFKIAFKHSYHTQAIFMPKANAESAFIDLHEEMKMLNNIKKKNR